MISKTSTALLLLVAAAAALIFIQQEQKSDQFTEWKNRFGVVFTSTEDNYRRHIFL